MRPWDEVTIPLTQATWSGLSAVFEAVKGYRSAKGVLNIFGLREHLDRFQNSITFMRLRSRWNSEELAERGTVAGGPASCIAIVRGGNIITPAVAFTRRDPLCRFALEALADAGQVAVSRAIVTRRPRLPPTVCTCILRFSDAATATRNEEDDAHGQLSPGQPRLHTP